MERTLDFNSVKRPSMLLTMKDEAKTKIHVSTPTEALVEELQTVSAEMDSVLSAGDSESVKASFDLAARLINCNSDGIRVTADELRGKYNIDLVDLVLFFSIYTDFVDEIGKAKN